MGRVDGKIALVTGAAQGLGAATAIMLAREGAKVALTDINLAGAQEQAEAINAEIAGAAIAFEQDVADEKSWQRVLDDIKQQFGGLNILVNNAGIGSVASVEDETFESGGGSIVNISSISGIIAGHNLAAYNSAKAAVRHLSKSVALHCARARNKIRSNSIHPVFIDTPILDGMAGDNDRAAALEKLGRQIPIGHIGQPDDVAYAVLYLASDESKFVTGTEIRVDGGISAM